MRQNIETMNRGRSMLRQLRGVAKSVGLKGRDVRPHELLLYAKLEANKKVYTFDVNKRSSGQHDMEIRLDENDMFLAYAAAIGVHKVNLDATQNEEPGSSQVIYTADPVWFPTGVATFGLGTLESQDIQKVWTGLLKVESEQDIRLKEYNAMRFQTAPETRVAADGYFQYDGGEVKDLFTGLGFWGGNRDNLELKLGPGTAANIAGNIANNGHQNYAVIRLVGHILVGGAKKATAARMTQLFKG